MVHSKDILTGARAERERTVTASVNSSPAVLLRSSRDSAFVQGIIVAFRLMKTWINKRKHHNGIMQKVGKLYI